MNIIFYISAVIAVVSTILVITRTNAVHALLYLVVSLLSIAVVFYTLGAPFIAALEVIIYAGAIMVLFIFVIMMLNLGGKQAEQESQWLGKTAWIGPAVLSLILFVEFVILLINAHEFSHTTFAVNPKQIGISLFGTYLLGVELAAMLLMAGIIGAFHIGNRERKPAHRFLNGENK